MAWLWQRDIDDEKRTPHAVMKMKNMLGHREFRMKSAEKELKSLGLKAGHNILDFGCGSGVYTFAAAKIVGDEGTVHAVDIHPTVIYDIESRALKLGIRNIDTIYSDLETGIGRGSVDMVIFYDVLRKAEKRRELLSEAHRVLKKSGTLLVKQSGMKTDRVKDFVLKDGFFNYMGNHGKIMKFGKILGKFTEIS
ncbi:MAG: class I SAM-dependent methyltransferase [Candidatus Aenigmarchaeota archaeon]|nr:class I SAM-dependent methyltransferase [Candidatus Aenigmarchaeota archaeon]